MFYNSKITILAKSDGGLDDLGIYQPGQTNTLKTIACDVQPYSKELAYRDYGFNEEVNYRFFCDPDNSLVIGGFVEYQNTQYEIKKIVPWDGFYEVHIYG